MATENVSQINKWELQPITEDWKGYATDEFQNEKEFCDHIEENLDYYCHALFEDSLSKYTREYTLGADNIRGGRPRRVDFMIRTQSGENILVECKHPSNTSTELHVAISQLLVYFSICELRGIPVDRMAIITTRFDELVRHVIRRFSLPISVFIVGRNKILKPAM